MTPLVLVHGFMGGSAQWRLQQQDLGRKRELVTIDLPGFGKNNHLDAANSIASFAQFVLDRLTDMKLHKFDLLGHSMGGMIVQEMMALAPNRICRLVLYGTAATGNLPGRFETFEQSRQRVSADGVTATARRISATWFAELEAADEFENCAALAERSTLQAMLAALDAMEVWDRIDGLKNIPCPTLIVWGEADRTYRWPQIEALWRGIPRSSLAVIPGCSHAVHMEKPGIFNSVVNDFLN